MKKMKLLIPGNIVFPLIAFVLLSCGKKTELLQHIPGDANFVITLDVKKIGSRIKELKSEEIEKIKNSGLDFSEKAFIFGDVDHNGRGYGVLSVQLSDAEKFEEFLIASDTTLKISSEGDMQFASVSMAGLTIGWNKNMAMVLRQSSFEPDKARQKIIALFQLKKEESISKGDENFQKAQKQEADISLWMNLEKFGHLVSAYNPSGSTVSFKETYLHANCNFENGQMLINGLYYPNKETAKVLSIAKPEINKEVIEGLPGKTALGVLGLALNMDSTYAYFEKEKLLENFNFETKETGLSPKEVFELLSGDFVASFNGARMVDEKDTDWMTGEEIIKKEPKAEYCIILGVRNKNQLSKALTNLTKSGKLKIKANYYTSANGELIIADKGNYLLIGSSENILQQNANGEKLNPETNQLLAQNTFALQGELSNLQDEVIEKWASPFKDQIKSSPLETIILSASLQTTIPSSGKMVVAFKDKTQSSLVSLIKMYELLGHPSAAEAN